MDGGGILSQSRRPGSKAKRGWRSERVNYLPVDLMIRIGQAVLVVKRQMMKKMMHVRGKFGMEVTDVLKVNRSQWVIVKYFGLRLAAFEPQGESKGVVHEPPPLLCLY